MTGLESEGSKLGYYVIEVGSSGDISGGEFKVQRWDSLVLR